jgi:heparan-alpha-glucosaminide N-acetyltransferase
MAKGQDTVMSRVGTFVKTLPQTALGSAVDRLVSLDAYRGFVILMMIWVNYMEEMPGIPHVLKHAKITEDTFTFPDLVFPGFLFMVGIAIPLAFAKKLNEPWWPLFRKILWRTATLLAVGVVYENAHRYDPKLAFLPASMFKALFYASVIMLWLQTKKKWVSWTGAAILVLLMVTFRGRIEDEYTNIYLYHTFWGILGLIGWAYLICTTIFLLARGSGTALMGAMAFLLVIFMGDSAHRFDFLPQAVRSFIAIGAIIGSTAANVMIGAIVGLWFLPKEGHAPGAEKALHIRRIRNNVVFAAGMILAAILLRPYHPISKIIATETFTLVTAGINLLGFTVFYILLDVWKVRAWAALLITAGTNALFAYILPDLVSTFFGLLGLEKVFERLAWPTLETGGPGGIANAVIMTLVMLVLTQVGTKLGARLKS